MNAREEKRSQNAPVAQPRRTPSWTYLLTIAREHPRISLPLAAMACVDLVLVGAALILQSFFTIRLFYGFNTVLVPITFAAMAVDGFVRWNRRPYERVALRLAAVFAVIAAGLTAFRVYATHIEPHRLHVRTVTIRSTHATQPLRILHIADIQSNVVGPYDERVFRTMRELNPDLILFTGDLLQPQPPTTMAEQLPKMIALLSTLSPRYGLWGVRGDTDWRLSPELVAANRQGVNNLGGLRLLEGESVEIPTSAGTVRLLGLSNPQSIGRGAKPVVDSWFRQASDRALSILIGHHPDYILSVQDLPIDLCLAGHTHGGQVRIPFLGPIVTLSDVPRAWARGFHETGRTRLNVSTGIGVEHMEGVQPIRVLCPPELVLIEIVPVANPANTGSMVHEVPGILGALTGRTPRSVTQGHPNEWRRNYEMHANRENVCMSCAWVMRIRSASHRWAGHSVHGRTGRMTDRPWTSASHNHSRATGYASATRSRASRFEMTTETRLNMDRPALRLGGNLPRGRQAASPYPPPAYRLSSVGRTVPVSRRDGWVRETPSCCSRPPPHDIVSRVNTVPQYPELS